MSLFYYLNVTQFSISTSSFLQIGAFLKTFLPFLKSRSHTKTGRICLLYDFAMQHPSFTGILQSAMNLQDSSDGDDSLIDDDRLRDSDFSDLYFGDDGKEDKASSTDFVLLVECRYCF